MTLKPSTDCKSDPINLLSKGKGFFIFLRQALQPMLQIAQPLLMRLCNIQSSEYSLYAVKTK